MEPKFPYQPYEYHQSRNQMDGVGIAFAIIGSIIIWGCAFMCIYYAVFY